MSFKELNVTLAAPTKKLEKDLNKASWKIKRFGRKMKSVGKNMTASLTLPIVAAGGVAVKAAAKYEKLKVQLSTLSGSAAKGAEAFKKLKEFAARTPFQLGNLAKAQTTLQGFGLSTDQAFSSIQKLADIAGVTGAQMQPLIMAFGQASAEGKAMTRDIRQFINAGVPMIKLLSESMGVAKSEILGMASEGKISFEVIQKAITEATSAGGDFANGTAKLAETVAGKFSTLRDNVEQAMAEVGQAIVDAGLIDFLESAVDKLRGAVDWFSNLSKSTQTTIVKVAGLAAALGPLITVMGVLVSSMGSIVGSFGTFAAIGRQTVGLFGGLTKAIGSAVPVMKALNLVVRANPLGALVTVLGLAAGAWYAFSGSAEDAKEDTYQVDAQIRETQSSMNSLFEAVKQTNEGTETRRRLIGKLNRKYGGYIDNLIDEKDSINDITAAQNEANKAIERNVIAKAFKKDSSEISDKIAELVKEKVSIAEESGKAQRIIKEADTQQEMLNAFIEHGTAAQQEAAMRANPEDIQFLTEQQEAFGAEMDYSTAKIQSLRDELKKLMGTYRDTAKAMGLSFDKIMGGGSGVSATSGSSSSSASSDAAKAFEDNKIDPIAGLSSIGSGSVDHAMTPLTEGLNTVVESIKNVGSVKDKNWFSPKSLGELRGKFDMLRSSISDITGVTTTLGMKFTKLGENFAQIFENEKWQKMGEMMGQVGTVAQGLFATLNQGEENRIRKIQQRKEEELAAIESSRMSTKRKEEARQTLREKTDKKIKKLERKKAKREKAMGIFQAIINTAVGVTNALSSGNPILAGIIGAMGAVQIGVISSQQLPALKEGGLAYGPTQAMIGDNVDASVNPEVIAPLDKLEGMMQRGDQRIHGEVRIDGRDLLIALDNARYTQNRRG